MAWLAVHYSQASMAKLMRMMSRCVGGICARVATTPGPAGILMAGVRRIGLDEISHRGHLWNAVADGRFARPDIAELTIELATVRWSVAVREGGYPPYPPSVPRLVAQ